MGRTRRLFVTSAATASLLSGLFLARAVNAQSGKIAAEALFEDARRLVSEGKYAEACPKFADSQRIDPTPGTLLNLANCYEKLAQTASAWGTYKEAASLAAAAGRADLVAAAEKHADALAPKLTRLTINVAAPVDGLRIKRDGALITAAERGSPIPVDPGRHTVEAMAPNKKPWSTTIDVADAGVAVTVPTLEDGPIEPAPAAVAPISDRRPGSEVGGRASDQEGGLGTQRTVGLVVGAAGFVGIALGTVFAIRARSEYSDSLPFCPNEKNLCTSDGVSRRDDARASGNVATVAFGAGGAALATGAALFIFAPRTSPKHSGMSLEITPTVGGTGVRGRW